MRVKNNARLMFLKKIVRTKVFLFGMLFILAAAGFFYVRGSWITEGNKILKQAMDIAKTAEATLSKEDLAVLDVSATDAAMPEYKILKDNMIKLIRINSEFRFAYIYTQIDGKVYFVVDSEPEGSEDYSPPGQEYTEADEETILPFESGEALVTKPATDRWGTWISMLVPIKDSLSGKTIAVFGMDYPAETWNRRMNSHALQGASLVAALLLLILASAMIIRRNSILRESQTQLKLSNEKNLLLTNVTIEGIVIHKDLKIYDLNPSLLRMFGYERGEMIGIDFSEFFSTEDKPIVRENVNSHSSQPYFASAVKKSGETFPVTIEGREFQMNGEMLRAASVRDITLQKQAEDALRESNARIRAITDSAQDGIMMIDHNGFITYWNPSSERLLGYTADEAIGQNLHAFIAPSRYRSMYEAAFPAFQQTGLGNAIGKTNDMNALNKDGTEIPVQISLSAVKISGGWNAIGIIRDITQQKNAEADLVKAKEIAETATRTKSEFLANMSHEIRTPMNAVIGFSRLMAKTDMTYKQHDYIRKIDSSANALLGIINDILDFSKIEAGKLEIESVNFQLDDVVNNIVEMVAVKAAEKNIELLSNVQSDVPRALVGDPLRLGQILVNLASNAVKFTDKGHILIKAELLCKDLDVCRIRFSVTDTGIGMSREQVDRLFTAFTQADTSITRKYGGTGLGLTISKRLAEMMDGEIYAESKLGGGSTFSYIASFKRQAEITENRAREIESLRKLKVLIVDDNEIARSILKDYLFALGIHAAEADTGQAAIEAVKRESYGIPYDLVLMDLRMPGMDGLEAARKITADKDIARIPQIIIVSAFGREEVIKQAEDMGIETFLMKPVNPHLLKDTLLHIFDRDVAVDLHTALKFSAKEASTGEDGILVLLAEDNILNQEVATAILRSAGMTVDIANNGKEAVAAVANKLYDIVLMDIQMPLMGGYEATKLIRTNARYKDLPIIAMTANAMQGAREECLAAGMNDYISKPIDPDALFLVIRKWFRPGDRTIKNTTRLENKPNENGVPFSLKAIPGVDIEAGLKRLNGNRVLYKKLLLDFSGMYSSSRSNIWGYLEQSDTSSAQRLIHTIKGVAGNISAYEIQNIAAQLEKAIAGNIAREADHLLIDLDKAIKSMNDALNALPEPYAAIPVESEKAVGVVNTETLILDLARLISENNVNAEQTMEELRKQLDPNVFDDEMKALTVCIGDYDFDSAKAVLQKIACKMNIILGGN
jgi:two-component system, sensor histidine kinase and response regulator